MNKQLLATGLLACFMVIAPMSASALTVADLQLQIKELLSRISVLQSVSSTNASTSISGKVQLTIATPRICGMLNRNISQGARGDDVRGLQEFLLNEGVFSASATGYFGPVTTRALAAWQSKEGVQSVGSLGPLTRERIKFRCGTPQNEFGFRVTPQAGTAPLTVTAFANVGGFSIYRYAVDFGDGSARQSIACNAPADACIEPGAVKHTYTQDGVYTVSLYRTHPGGCGVNADPRCLGMPAQEVVIAKETVRVGSGPIACTKEYKPVCGAKPIVCITTPCNPIPTTYGNICSMRADGASYLYDGECRDTSAGGAPTISRFSGPTTLAVNESGTWNISASDPENGRLSYSIAWGDEWARSSIAGGTTSAESSIVQETTFTHAYSNPGAYTISVTVTDESGKSAQVSSSVQVTQSACTAEYAPVCGRPQGCANTCAPGMYCTMMCRLYDPVSYSNRCQLNNANATFLHTGVCTGAESY